MHTTLLCTSVTGGLPPPGRDDLSTRQIRLVRQKLVWQNDVERTCQLTDIVPGQMSALCEEVIHLVRGLDHNIHPRKIVAKGVAAHKTVALTSQVKLSRQRCRMRTRAPFLQ